MKKYPFTYDPTKPYVQQASDWIADVFYDILPEAGFELRDEQIYMAFQLERAYSDKRTIFAEAGVGTGKTLVYLLYAISYARYTRKPAIIACADESLIEQLVKPEGDIAKLAKYLDFTIDARLGKSPDQYLCLNKLDDARGELTDAEDDLIFQGIHEGLPPFVNSPDTMQAFHPYGNRKDYPELTDVQWGKLGWDVFQDCMVCTRRHRCGQTLSREHYRKSADLIICSHDFYMEHVWTYDARKREGQLPLLPEHSSVVFDEGHLLETAAQSALTYKLKHSVFENIVIRLLEGEVRETTAVAIENAISQSEHLFSLLEKYSVHVPASDRREIVWNAQLLKEVNHFRDLLAVIEEELVFEGALHTIEAYQMKIVEEHLEMINLALGLCTNPDTLISWLETNDGTTFVIMPKLVKEVLEESVFAKHMPIIFSSATLSLGGSFAYIAESLGISKYLSFSVDSPFDYKEKMKVLLPRLVSENKRSEKINLALELLQKTEGRALILFPSREELEEFKQDVSLHSKASAFRFLFEGTAEISHLISAFQNEEASILCAVTLWEGLDIPGPSLSHVIIWSLPFPPNDPVFAAKRKDASNPFDEVDMPHMLLRFKQGIGRLIRTREDEGYVTIFGEEMNDADVKEKVIQLLPAGVHCEEVLLTLR
ncbi:MAG: ATP-dependent DNA helicase [Gorillibacterium sp.]|nr:ATP-dependent DNA helicase [Gorillibacterium sp.]